MVLLCVFSTMSMCLPVYSRPKQEFAKRLGFALRGRMQMPTATVNR